MFLAVICPLQEQRLQQPPPLHQLKCHACSETRPIGSRRPFAGLMVAVPFHGVWCSSQRSNSAGPSL